MRNLLLFVLFIGNSLTICGQDDFANALVSLNAELEFKPKTASYANNEKPNEQFIIQFKECAESEHLERLSELDFENIINAKHSELFTTKWEGKWQIEFREWEFNNEHCVTDFMAILENLSQSRIQVCVNKGGIMWWKTKTKIYMVTSRAYFVTYHYKEIKEAILNGLEK